MAKSCGATQLGADRFSYPLFGEDSPLSMRINPLNRDELPPFDARCPPAARAQAERDARPRRRAVLALGGLGRLEQGQRARSLPIAARVET